MKALFLTLVLSIVSTTVFAGVTKEYGMQKSQPCAASNQSNRSNKPKSDESISLVKPESNKSRSK